MKYKFKIGEIVKDKKTKQLGIIVAESKGGWDYEVFAIKNKFEFGHVWQDCFMESGLEKYHWRKFPRTLIEFKQQMQKETLKELEK